MRLGGMQSPQGTAELEKRSAALLEEVEEAVRQQDFERAAALRKERSALEAQIEKERGKAGRGRSRKALRVGENEIAQVVAEWTKIPVSKLAETEARSLGSWKEPSTSA